MRVVVTGAGGNAGTSVVKALAADRTVTDVLGVARRRPGLHIPGVRWTEADIDPGRSDLTEVFAAPTPSSTRPVHGPFNLVADPVLNKAVVAGLLHARTLPLPVGAARAALAAARHVRLVPADPGLLDAVATPLLDAGRAHDDLGWTRRPPPRRPAV